MTRSNKEIVLEVLKRAFIDRDPTVVEQYFAANYKQHNPAKGPEVSHSASQELTVLQDPEGSADGGSVYEPDPNL